MDSDGNLVVVFAVNTSYGRDVQPGTTRDELARAARRAAHRSRSRRTCGTCIANRACARRGPARVVRAHAQPWIVLAG